MPIGVVDDSQFEAELNSLNPTKSTPSVTPTEIVEMERPGRSEGDVNVPDSLRKIIGETAVIDGRQEALAIAKMFGVSDSSVSAYSQGATSTASYNKPNPSITSHLSKSRMRAINRAQKKLHGALDAMSQEKLDSADAKDLSTIAKDMSVIIKNLEPEKVQDNTDGIKVPQFVIYAPQFRDERSFDRIQVVEE